MNNKSEVRNAECGVRNGGDAGCASGGTLASGSTGHVAAPEDGARSRKELRVRNKSELKLLSPLMLLFPYQKRWVMDSARFKIGVWSRQSGKSFSTAAESVTDCILFPKTKWVCLSASERQALEWLEKAKEWTALFKQSLAGEEQVRDAAEALLKSAEIRFANGSRIMAIPGKPATARGYSTNIVLDEFAYHENPNAVWSAMFPNQSNPLAGMAQARYEAMLAGEDFSAIQRELKLRVVSTFNGRDNKFYSMWERREQTGYSGHFIDIYSAVKDGLPLNIEQLRTGLDDAEIWAQEYECSPADVSAVLLPYELLASCESPEATVTIGPDYFTSGKPYVMGIDFARKRDLSVAWTDELMGDVAHCREVLEMRDMSTPDQIALLRPRIRGARRVCLDYTSPGLGLGDFLVKEFGEYNPAKHLYGKIELCTFTNPLKVELFSKLRMAFEQRQCRIPISRAVREDMHSVQRMTSNSGNITYRAPHTEDGHADRCTAKALAHRAMGCGRTQVAYAAIKGNGPSANEIRRFFGVGSVNGGGGPAYGSMPSHLAEWQWAEEQARKKGRSGW